VPLLISGGIITLGCVAANVSVLNAVKYTYMCCIYSITAIMIVTFSMLVAGNSSAGTIFSFGFMILPAFVIIMADGILEINMYGYYSDTSDIMSKIYILGIENICSKDSVLYIAFAVIMFFVNLWLYKIRKLENYDETVAYAPLKWVFVYTVAVCFGYLGYITIYSFWSVNSLFFGTLPLGCIALIAAFMLNRKSFSLKGIAVPLICFVIIAGIVNLVIKYDILGREKYVPNPEQVESVITYNPTVTYYADNNDYEPYEKNSYKGEVTSYDGIKTITDIHKYIANNKQIEDSENTQYIKFLYKLKNGKTFNRSYTVDMSTNPEVFAPYFEREEYKKTHYPITNDNKKRITTVAVDGVGTCGRIDIDFDSDELLAAIKDDIMSIPGTAEISDSYKNVSMNSIDINYTEYLTYHEFNFSDEFKLGKYTPKTLALVRKALEEKGNYMYTAEDISSIDLDANVSIDNLNSKKSTQSITDKNDIAEIYDIFSVMQKCGDVGDGNNIDCDDSVDISLSFNTSRGNFINIITVQYNRLPYVLLKYMTSEE
jgi:hypothetical protein